MSAGVRGGEQKMSDWDVLSFSLRLDWQGGVAHTAKSMLCQMARERKVLNFNPPTGWRTVLRQPRSHAPRLYRVQDNLWHFEWGYLYPKFYRPPIGVRVTGFAARLCVQYLCRKLRISAPIYLFWGPFQAELLPHLPRRFTTYYAYDPFTMLQVDRDQWKKDLLRREQILLDRADVVFAVSQPLATSLQERGVKEVYVIPNGVDVDALQEALGSAEPPDLRVAPRPRLAYIGFIREETDLQAFYTIATSRPGWSIVLIGEYHFVSAEQRQWWDKLTALPNVYYLGKRAYSEIPSYYAGIDVALVLYRRDTAADYGSPLKLYEALGAGLPVIASRVPDSAHLENVVYVAANSEQCISLIEAALEEQGVGSYQRRILCARQNSWEVRAQSVTNIINRYLLEK
jgi:glycosyltransferase involved in cell wall biosynthesis